MPNYVTLTSQQQLTVASEMFGSFQFQPQQAGPIGIACVPTEVPNRSQSETGDLGRIELYEPGNANPVANILVPIGSPQLLLSYPASAAQIALNQPWTCRVWNGTLVKLDFDVTISLVSSYELQTASFDMPLLNLLIQEAIDYAQLELHIATSSPSNWHTWTASKAMAVGDEIEDPNGNVQVVNSVAGDAKTGTSQPTWPTTPNTLTQDNHVVWMENGAADAFCSLSGSPALTRVTKGKLPYFFHADNINYSPSAIEEGVSVVFLQPLPNPCVFQAVLDSTSIVAGWNLNGFLQVSIDFAATTFECLNYSALDILVESLELNLTILTNGSITASCQAKASARYKGDSFKDESDTVSGDMVSTINDKLGKLLSPSTARQYIDEFFIMLMRLAVPVSSGPVNNPVVRSVQAHVYSYSVNQNQLIVTYYQVPQSPLPAKGE